MRIKELREDRDITQKTLADYLHIKQNTYSQYENGQRQLPTFLQSSKNKARRNLRALFLFKT